MILRSQKGGDVMKDQRFFNEDDVTEILTDALAVGVMIASVYVANSYSYHPKLSEEKRQQLRIKKDNDNNRQSASI